MFELANHDFEVTRAHLVPFVSAGEETVFWGAELVAEGTGRLAD
jgi:hypothetical protein